MITERDIRQACRTEHGAIVDCCAQWDAAGVCTPELQAVLQHHQVVLSALRYYLAQQYHADFHGSA